MSESVLCECGISKQKHDDRSVRRECHMRLHDGLATCDGCGWLVNWNGDSEAICKKCARERDYTHSTGYYYSAFA